MKRSARGSRASRRRSRTPTTRSSKGLKPGRSLDVGMGQGRNTIYLAQQGWDSAGFDPADRAVAGPSSSTRTSCGRCLRRFVSFATKTLRRSETSASSTRESYAWPRREAVTGHLVTRFAALPRDRFVRHATPEPRSPRRSSAAAAS